MKAKGFAAALAVMLFGGYAIAQDEPATAPADPMVAPDVDVDVAEDEADRPAQMEQDVDVMVQPVAEPARPVEEDRGIFAAGDQRGLSVAVAGGVEGYSGDLAPQIAAGPMWGVTAALKPTQLLGLELGYSGAINEVRTGDDLGAIGGVDLVRNGGHFAASLGLTTTAIQPYLLGGIGFSRYDARGGAEQGFQDDTVGNIPLGAGLRAEFGRLMADARFGYNVLFDQQFANNVVDREIAGINSTAGARYNGTLSIGASF